MNKAQLFLRKHSSTILTVIGAGGVVVTSVLAVKATPKALELIEEEKQRREEGKIIFNNDEYSYEKVIVPDLTRKEIVQIAWKPYIPAVIVGISTIACIFGANYLNKRQQAALMSAYALLDSAYKEYRAKTKELYANEAIDIEKEIIKSKLDPNIELDDDKELFFDYQSMRWFEARFEDVKRAEMLLNQQLTTQGFACLNDFYEYLHEPKVPYGYQLGWSTMNSDRMYAYDEILLEFDYQKVEMDDGLECNIMTINYSPSLEYMS